MGLFEKLASFLGMKRKEVNILVIGLNNSGKSTIVNQFKNEQNKSREIVPTVGFQVEKFDNGPLSFTAFDMSGRGRDRDLWEHYYGQCDGIIFVIDSTDTFRLVVVKEELDVLLAHPHVVGRKVPIIFFANKMDSENALGTVNIASSLRLDRIVNKPWLIQASNALNGDGLDQGIEWLTQQIREIILPNK